MRKVALFLLFIAIPKAYSDEANARICVGNFTGGDLTWSLVDKEDGRLAVYKDNQTSGKQWSCGRVQSKDYEFTVSSVRGKFVQPSCLMSFKGGEWVEVTRENGDGNLICNLKNSEGQLAGVTYQMLGAEEGVTLRGQVMYSGPVQDATIKVYDGNGRALDTDAHATWESGRFAVTLFPVPRGPFRVEASGGTVNGKAFRGTLSARIGDNFDFDSRMVYVNLVTTMVDAYLHKFGDTSMDMAQARLKTTFHIPEGMDIGLGINNPHQMIFDAKRFESEAERNGGLSIAIASIVDASYRDMSFTKDMRVRLMKNNLGNPPVKFDPKSWVADKFVGGMVSAAGGMAFQFMLSAMGFESTEDKIYSLVKQINARLDVIEGKLGAIEHQMQVLEYNTRSDKLHDFIAVAQAKDDLMIQYKEEQKRNLLPNGQPKSVVVQATIENKFKTLRTEILASLKDALPIFNRYLVGDGNGSLFTLWANEQLPQLVTVNYLESLWNHLEYYKSGQALIAALVAGSYAIEVPDTDKNILAQYKKWADLQTIKYPTHPLALFVMTHPELKPQFEEGQIAVDIKARTLWKTDAASFKTRTDAEFYMKQVFPAWRFANETDVQNLYSSMKTDQGWTTGLILNGFKINSYSQYFYLCCTWENNIFTKARSLRVMGMTQGPFNAWTEEEAYFINRTIASQKEKGRVFLTFIVMNFPEKFDWRDGKPVPR